MNKVVRISLCIMIGFCLTACGDKAANDSSGSTENKAQAKETYNLTLGHICSENTTIHRACAEFERYIEEKSEGKIAVEIHPNAVLGGDEAMMESVALGTLTMVIPSASVMNAYVPEYGILAMPYLFPDVTTAFEAVDGELGTYLDQKLLDAEVGFVNLGYAFNGIRNMTNNKRAIRTPEDLKGLKMRCMSNEMFVTMFKLLGANATPMSWSELFTAMQQGTVDGEENPASLIYESKFQEVQKHLSTTEHIYDFCPVIINSAFYNNLGEDLQGVIQEGTKLYLEEHQRALEVGENENYLKKLAEEGMEVTYLTPEEKAVFADCVAPMYQDISGEFGADVANLVAAYR